MAAIWANRLVAGTKTWDKVPDVRREAVLAELRSRVNSGDGNAITAEQFQAITGEVFA